MAHLNIETGKKKDIRGRRIVGYWARYSEVQGDGKTPEDALKNLDVQLTEISKSHHTRVTTFFGHVIVVSFSCHSWQYNIIRPEHFQTKPKDVWSCASGFASQEDACRKARMHLADNLLAESPEAAFQTVDPRDKDDLLHRQQSMKQYAERIKTAREYGMNENQAHLYALCAPGVTLPAEKPAQGILNV